ncbi:DUF3606 domain-containing protein [Aquincola sp. MAHUQ-54]|uniref:DUF3606 domain-containing protein n=1 Tax=Aquincola agrisoli TaxID=3119538 RepID=A0AAW9QAT0_9BURK
MSQAIPAAGDPGTQRIDVQQAQALRDWAKKFDVTPEQIKEAVDAVGDSAPDVEQHLKGSKATSNSEQAASK